MTILRDISLIIAQVKVYSSFESSNEVQVSKAQAKAKLISNVMIRNIAGPVFTHGSGHRNCSINTQ